MAQVLHWIMLALAAGGSLLAYREYLEADNRESRGRNLLMLGAFMFWVFVLSATS